MASACRELGFHEPQITMQGGFIASPLGGAVMRARTLRADEVLDHLDFARLIGLTPVVTFPDGHRAERWPRGVARLNGAALAESLRFELVPSLEAIAGRGAIRTFIPTPPRRHAEVRDLARKMGLDLERDVAAIGDGPNDVEMLRVAGRSVALGSAPADVKAAAGQVVPAEAPDGAVQAIGLLFPALVEPTRRTSPLPDLHGSEVGAR